MSSVKNELTLKRSIFSAKEKRNIVIYIFGIVLYKFGLEAFNGSIITLATNRFDQDALKSRTPAHTFEKVGLVAGLNQALQCIGSILIAPLIKHWPIRTVLSISIFVFAIFTAILIILDAATGGYIKPKHFNSTNKNDFSYYGHYKSDWIILIFGITGIAYGTVESIHRVIPRDIVGYHVQKLQTFDALVHVFYAISGAIGALVTGLVLIPGLGNNYAFIITPILFTASGMIWLFMSTLKIKKTKRKVQVNTNEKKSKSNYFKTVIKKMIAFVESIYIGGKIIFTSRKYIWLFSCYLFALYAHRYLEDAIAPQVARRYLKNSAWSEIIVGGSNFGELLGSFFILFFSNSFRTPLPWLRISALLLLIVWYIPYCYPPANSIKYAWIIGSTFIPISFGWAASDIALAAHIQSSMTRLESSYEDVSVLGAVMSFLYSSYIIIYAIANPFLGKYIDSVYKVRGTIRPALFYTVGVQFTLIMAIILASTFIPSGAFSFNPKIDDKDEDEEDSSDESGNADALIDKNHQLTEFMNS
jgi:MFS family permease